MKIIRTINRLNKLIFTEYPDAQEVIFPEMFSNVAKEMYNQGCFEIIEKDLPASNMLQEDVVEVTIRAFVIPPADLKEALTLIDKIKVLLPADKKEYADILHDFLTGDHEEEKSKQKIK